MTTQELIDILRRYAADGCLAAVVQSALTMLDNASSVKIVLSEVQSRDSLLRIYEGRLRRASIRGDNILGLVETVESFKNNTGTLCGGYAETQHGLVYFWINYDSKLVGCIM